jgi:methylated-DNA-[protein]-cysteine S-methyltransferase
MDKSMIYYCGFDSPLGPMSASAENGAITGLWFSGQKYFPVRTAESILEPEYPVFKALISWLSVYFSGKVSLSNHELHPQGTPFQKAVWNILLKIPYGKTRTYGDIAREIAALRGISRMSAQAVGGAVGHNPISILIPCHRVIGSNGSLIGYAGGLDKKRALLIIEGIILD